MGIFDFFRRRSREEKEFIESMKDINRKLDQSKYLKKGDLRTTSDDELRTVVMGWMWGKIEEDWSLETQILEDLPEPCRNVYACVTSMEEVLNGGLNQLFFNSSVKIAEMAQKGFRSMGLDELSVAMQKAIEVYEENKELIEEYDDDTIEGFSESYELKLFDDLDGIFNQAEAIFERSLIDFIRINEGVFGD